MRRMIACFLAAVLSSACLPAHAQMRAYPEKSVRVIVPAPVTALLPSSTPRATVRRASLTPTEAALAVVSSTRLAAALLALYLNVFVGVVQSFLKIPALRALAPKQTEPPFVVSQGIVFAAFVALAIVAAIRFRAERIGADAGR